MNPQKDQYIRQIQIYKKLKMACQMNMLNIMYLDKMLVMLAIANQKWVPSQKNCTLWTVIRMLQVVKDGKMKIESKMMEAGFLISRKMVLMMIIKIISIHLKINNK